MKVFQLLFRNRRHQFILLYTLEDQAPGDGPVEEAPGDAPGGGLGAGGPAGPQEDEEDADADGDDDHQMNVDTDDSENDDEVVEAGNIVRNPLPLSHIGMSVFINLRHL